MKNPTKFLFAACVEGTGPKLVSSKPMIKTQGNGNFTGLIMNTYDDGFVAHSVFIENAASKQAVVDAYASIDA